MGGSSSAREDSETDCEVDNYQTDDDHDVYETDCQVATNKLILMSLQNLTLMLSIKIQNLNILLLKFRQQMEEHILLLKRRGGALEEGIFIILDFVRLYQVRWCWYYQHHLHRKEVMS